MPYARIIACTQCGLPKSLSLSRQSSYDLRAAPPVARWSTVGTFANPHVRDEGGDRDVHSGSSDPECARRRSRVAASSVATRRDSDPIE
jgi:hypothetical protein